MSNETNYTEQIIKQMVQNWTAGNKQVSAYFTKFPNEANYFNEVAPGRNRAIYLLGHLISSTDGMLPLLGIGERLYPELQQTFSASPDRAVTELPTLAELKEKWEKLSSKFNQHISSMTANDWMGRHTAVSEEDFAKEPHRNKLNVLLSRTTHQSYHMGQLNLLSAEAVAA